MENRRQWIFPAGLSFIVGVLVTTLFWYLLRPPTPTIESVPPPSRAATSTPLPDAAPEEPALVDFEASRISAAPTAKVEPMAAPEFTVPAERPSVEAAILAWGGRPSHFANWRTRQLGEFLKAHFGITEPIDEEKRDQLEDVLNFWRGQAVKARRHDVELIGRIVSQLEKEEEFVEGASDALPKTDPTLAARVVTRTATVPGSDTYRRFVVDSNRFPEILDSEAKFEEILKNMLIEAVSVMDGRRISVFDDR